MDSNNSNMDMYGASGLGQQVRPVQPVQPVRPIQPVAVRRDFGAEPFVVDINKATTENDTYRTALWSGEHLQLTVMSIPVGGDIGLEMHSEVDQFLRIEKGHGLAMMGRSREELSLQQPVFEDTAIFVPAGTWHNLVNTGGEALKLYSIYAPPKHPKGTVHATKAVAEMMGD